MPVIGMSFGQIEAKRNKTPTGEIKINSTPKINDVKEIKMDSLGGKKVLALGFDFTTTYGPDIAEIKISGELLYLQDNEAKNDKVLKQWKKEKKIPEGISMEVLNNLFRKCLLKISTIADDLQLPPPIALPRVKPKGEETSYIG